jgi:hypothetical protein
MRQQPLSDAQLEKIVDDVFLPPVRAAASGHSRRRPCLA